MSLLLIVVIAAVVAVLGVVLTAVGLRGRVVGDDPHCRKCGFNLRGRDESSSPVCPECGSDISAPKATRVGVRRRRPAMLTVGLLILLVGGGALGVGGWQFASTYDWAPWKPVSWLMADLDSTDPKVRSDAYN